MPCSASDAARFLLGAEPLTLEPVAGGGNNRLYRVSSAEGAVFALKSYLSQAADPRDRLGAEFAALRFLRRHGVACVPAALAADRARGFALYEWIEGAPVGAPADADIDAALAFAAALVRLGRAEGAADLPAASEACLSAAELVAQVERRAARLTATGAPALVAFVQDELAPVAERAVGHAREGYRRAGRDFAAPLDAPALSPSDFGFHNAVRRPDGTLVFLDFEYFGWDDPVRLAADFLLHPAMELAPAHRQRFAAGLLDLYGGDAGFARRLELLFPLVGLRWCLIMLNEFLPERWSRRQFAGVHRDRATAQAAQLERARRRLAAVAERFSG